MRFSSYALPVLAANLVAALPRPQNLDFDLIDAAPDPTFTQAVGATAQTIIIDPNALLASATADISSVSVDAGDVLSSTAVAHKRAAAATVTCAPQPAGATSAPTYAADDDNVANFKANTHYDNIALSAQTPSDYSLAFSNKQASSNALGYLGFDTMDEYDVAKCAQQCTAKFGCSSFNIYFERDPSLDPTPQACPDPPSVTMIKCVYWGGQATDSNTVNVGQPRADFKVAIAGSNGYVTKRIATPAGYNTGIYYGKNAINAPYDAQGYNTFMGSKIFTGIWNVEQCAAYCESQSEYNTATAPKDGTPAKVCRFFNTYLLTAKMANGDVKPQGQYCSLYTEVWPEKYATNGGQWRGKDQYTIDYSFGYAKTDAGIDPLVGDAVGAKYQAIAGIKWSSLQPFCSTYLGFKTALATITTTATIIPTTTSTTYATSTVLPRRKRDDATLYPGLKADPSFGGLVLIDGNGINWYSDLFPVADPNSPGVAQKMKRDTSVAVPPGLVKYQPAVVSATCAMQVTFASSTSTVIQATTVTGAATTTVVSVVATVTGDPSEFAYVVLPASENNAAVGSYIDFVVNRTTYTPIFGGRRGTNTRKANIAVDPVTGYLQDVTTGKLAHIYTQGTPIGGGLTIQFSTSEALGSSYQPLICTRLQNRGAYLLSCSVTSRFTGKVISNFLGSTNLRDGVAGNLYLSATPGSRLSFGDALITIFDR
ncbi:hypothetical protein D6D01_09999 [Aureobasidium pullulans]|uniref:Apple domain-containing protein n=1 Tax=Aureobasidium pullulans TaxID=5580 RepID=A0A4S9JTM2_AURPU|nr:hypothetical protein D6D01_09999 [Aureobasidium pullulans]